MRKQIIILGTLLSVLIIGLIYFFNSNTNNLSQKEEREFAIKNTGEINKIFLVNAEGEKITLKKSNNHWIINNKYVARPSRIDLLLKTAKGIQVQQRVPKSQTQQVLKNLITSHIKAEFYKNEQLVKAYFIGSADGNSTGTYALLINPKNYKNASTPFITHLLGFQGYLTPRFEPTLNTWRDLKVFFFPENAIQSIKLEYPNSPQDNFTITLTDGSYQIAQNGKLKSTNKANLRKYLLNFKSVAAERLVKSPETILELKKKQPWFKLSVENISGKTTEVIGYKKEMPKGSTNALGLHLKFDPDRFYGACFNEDFCILQHYVFDPILAKYENF